MDEDFFERTATKEAEMRKWLSNFDGDFERAVKTIEKHQERKLLNQQTIMLVFIGAFFVNLLASAFYDFSNSLASGLSIQRLFWDIVIILVSVGISILAYFYVKKLLLDYKPYQPFLSLIIKPEDTKPFLKSSQFEEIMNSLKKGIRDFKTFGNGFFESLNIWFPYMFGDKVEKRPEKESEDFEDSDFDKQFPTMTKQYKISKMLPLDVNIVLDVILYPRVIYTITNKGDESSVHSFYLNFMFIVSNPEQSKAIQFLDTYYHVYASHIIEFCSYALDKALVKLNAEYERRE